MPSASTLRLAALTTMRIGGPVASLVDATTESDLIDAVAAADERGRRVLVLGGGSNLMVGDDGFEGLVVRDARHEIAVESADACGGASFTVTAGMPWDGVVARAVAEGWSGIEALSGIPGSTGATPVQNVGAYGQEIGDVLSVVRTWDRAERRIRTFARSELGLGYRTSILKTSLDPALPWYPSPRYVVLSVGLQTRLASLSEPVRYPELARTLGVEVGERVDAARVREAVLGLRRGKGMVLDADDHDTWSAGSFFTNPVLPESAVPDGAPRFPAADGLVKTSAAWLIQAAGFERGYPGEGASARLSTKHVLALTNRGGAEATDLLQLARAIRDGVARAFGITLEPEPVLLGVSL